jgi:hypothetical protein
VRRNHPASDGEPIRDEAASIAAPQVPADTSDDPTEARNKFIETAAMVAIGEDQMIVALDCRCHDPSFGEATVDRDALSVPWIGRRRLVFTDR